MGKTKNFEGGNLVKGRRKTKIFEEGKFGYDGEKSEIFIKK